MKLIIYFFLFFATTQATAYRANSLDTSIYNECLWNQNFLDTEVDCGDLFNHYKPAQSKYKPKSDIRLGSYNIFRASEQRHKKNLELTAEMINAEWDIIALSELQPSSTADIKEFNKSGDYSFPSYITILLELQKRDSSWAMITSAYSQGADAEIFGFYYRGNQIKPIESNYCKTNHINNNPHTNNFIYRELTKEKGITKSSDGNSINARQFIEPKKAFACPLVLEGLYEEQFTKIPLTARFMSGNFEFSYIALHTSFNSFGERKSECFGTCGLNILKLISALNGDGSNSIIQDIEKFENKRTNKKTIQALDLLLPASCDKFNIGAKENNKEVKKYNTCKKKFTNFLEALSNFKVLPPASCKKIESKQETKKQYSQCKQDFAELKSTELQVLLDPAFKIFKTHLNKHSSYGEIVTKIFSSIIEDGAITQGESRLLNRYFQVYATLEQFEKIRNTEDTQDVIIGGDFNLEIESKEDHWRFKAWQLALDLAPGTEVLINEKTSINPRREHVNSYDHFILARGSSFSDECRAEEAHALDFLDPQLVLSNGFKLGKEVEREEYHHVLSDHLPISMSCTTK